MKTYKLFFLDGNKTILSKKPYSNEDEVKRTHPSLIISMDFDTIDEVEQYIRLNYRLDNDASKEKVSALDSTDEIELNL